MNLAIFDLDHTLLPLDSDYSWVKFYVARCPVEERAVLLAKNEALMVAYQAGVLDPADSLSFLIGLLARRPRAQLESWHADFMKEIIVPVIGEAALTLIKHHQDAGDITLISTATNSFVTQPIAQALGISTLIATEPQENTQREFTGQWLGTPNFGPGKVTRVQQWLEQQGKTLENFNRSFFYSDSINDLPLLNQVTDPIATNPSPALKSIAYQQGWKTIRIFE
ncbi:MAG: HAD-IB family hydrolase [Burkholderiaceae bacterium]|nr:HAD-IB family hydrolase [Burkholderiaceae bacterium]